MSGERPAHREDEMSRSRRCARRRLALLWLGVTTSLGLWPQASWSAEVRLLVAIGNNVGDPGEAPLRFADADARRVRDLFVELGDVAQERAVLVVNEGASAVRERLAEVRGRMAELRAAGHSITLVLYVSSHARAGALHLSGTELPLDELREFAAEAPARLKLVVIDACQSGSVARPKGGTPVEPFEVHLERLPIGGEVFITSSGPVEASQEWDSLGGSLFTHHWLTGLRGDADADGDGDVSLAESYAYAFRHTVVAASAVEQHPVFDMNLSGSGDLVLSQPARGKGALVFPAALSGRYVVASRPRPDVVAEITKQEGRPLRLAVPPGRYLVRKRLGTTVGLIELELPYGGTRTIDESQMQRRDFAEVALKGGRIEQRPHALLLTGRAQSPALRGTGLGGQGSLGYRFTWDTWWVQVDGSAGGRRFTAKAGTVTEFDGALGLSAGYRLLSVGPLVLQLGVSAEALVVRQSLRRFAEEEIERVYSQGPPAARTALGLRAGAVLAADVPIWDRLFAQLSLRPAITLLPALDQPAWTPTLEGALALGMRL
jgi:hypothetical protein